MASDPRAEVPGFFRSCWTFRSDIAKSWDFVAAVATIALVMVIPSDDHVSKAANSIATSAIAVSTALVGVVVAGLAVVVVFLDREFVTELDSATQEEGGIAGDYFPFWFVTATGVADVLLAVLLLVTSGMLPTLALRMLTAVVAGLLVWTAVGVFNLVAAMQALGVSRAIHLKKSAPRPIPPGASIGPAAHKVKTGTRR